MDDFDLLSESLASRKSQNGSDLSEEKEREYQRRIQELEEELRNSKPRQTEQRPPENTSNNYGIEKKVSTFSSAPPPSTSKGFCGACGQPVTGEHLEALGSFWHVDHLVCSSCSRPIDGEFFEEEGDIYCTPCTDRIYRCERCGGKITDKYFVSGSSKLHQNCLEKCVKCGMEITTSLMSAQGKTYHATCFTCTSCGQQLSKQFYIKEDSYYCGGCVNASGVHTDVKCDRCNGTITGTFVSHRGQKWHPNCFLCSGCQRVLQHDAFYERNNFSYCESCIKG